MLTKGQSAQLLLLSDYMDRKQLTQQELALATGVHQSQVSRILAGRARRTSRNLLKLCKYAETLSVPNEPTEGRDEEIVVAIRSLLGHRAEENQRLRDVVISLKAWRDSWPGKI